jgi:CheY-like chemotaxis protein
LNATLARGIRQEFRQATPRRGPNVAPRIGVSHVLPEVPALRILVVDDDPTNRDALDTPLDWLRRADEALYRAKAHGRNRVEAAPTSTRVGHDACSRIEAHKTGEEAMSEATNELKKDLQMSLAHLQTLRDEVRVKLHLAGKDLKDQWSKLEPHLEEVEQAAKNLSEVSRAAVVDALKRLEEFSASFR